LRPRESHQRPGARSALSRRSLIAALALLAAVPTTASGAWYGSTMRGPANAAYGCEAATIFAPLGGVQIAPTNQTSCTYQHNGYIGSNRLGSIVPSSGRIVRIRVRSGPNPARLRLTILTGSSRIDTTTGRDIPGTYTCCTARYVGPSFRPAANRLTVRRVNVPVFVTRSNQLQIRTHASDIVAVSASGPGTLPLRIDPNVGSLDAGSPMATGFWSATAKGDPRVDGFRMSGIDVLLGWDFRRRR
jgi:hypothetical protein